MIKIEIEKDKWEEIKKRHWTWCEPYIVKQIEFLKKFLKDRVSDKNYQKEIEFYDKYILKKLKVIILSEEIKDTTLNITNDKYIELIDKLKDKIDVEFCNEGIEILKVEINKNNRDDILRKITEYFIKYKENNFICDLEFKCKELTNENKITSMKLIIKELKNEFKNIKKYLSSFEERLKLIFNYNDFSSMEPPKWGRKEFLNLLGLETCPYCQRAYVTNFQDDEEKNTTADLDHFYPKAKYPYLALSLYNFVPSCKFCNSTGRKGDTDTYKYPHIYPYTDSMEEDIKFTIETDSFMDNIFTKNQNLNIDIDVISTDIEKNKKIENSLKTFKLKEVYKNSHSKYVGDLIHNFQKYPKSYTKALGEIFLETPKENSEENKTKEEIKRELEEKKSYQEKLQILNDNFQEIIKKPYTDKIEKGEPLAKLTKDIMQELGIK